MKTLKMESFAIAMLLPVVVPHASLCSGGQTERTKSRLSFRRLGQLLLGCVPLGFIRKARLKARTDLHQGRADGHPGGALR